MDQFTESWHMHMTLFRIIGDHLPCTKSDFKSFELHIPLTPRDKADHNSSAEELLRVWETRGGISVGNYEQLRKLLQDTRLTNVLRIAENHIARIMRQLRIEAGTYTGVDEATPDPVMEYLPSSEPTPVVDVNPLEVEVVKCDEDDSAMRTLFFNEEIVYTMRGKTTGVRVLIINNKTFGVRSQDAKNAPLSDRPGTDVDATALEQLFAQLGYKAVTTATNLTGQGIISAIQEEARDCRKTDNAFICVIMSHGTTASVYGVDGKLVQLKDIFDQLNGQKCPKLVGKPKIFIIQACQGEKYDAGSGVELNAELELLRLDGEEADSAATAPTMSDILVATATTEGYVSWRDPEKGSWFIQALVQVIQKYAYKCDLLQILTKTNALMGDKETKVDKSKQCAEQRNTFRKQFYFFPGFEER